jgi:hypothetical protein
MTPHGKMDRPSDLRTREVPEATTYVLELPIAPRRVSTRKELENQRLLMEMGGWLMFALVLLGFLAVAIAIWLV